MRRFGWLLPLLIAAVVASLPFLGVVGPVRERQIMLAAIYGLVVAGFNLAFGYGGQLALGQVAVFAGGAYTGAILHQHGVNELLIGVLVAIAVAVVLGLVTGLPGVRFSEWSLALMAFFLVVLIPSVTNLFESETGGVIGIPGIKGPTLLGVELTKKGFYVVTVCTTALLLLLFRNVVQSRFGHGLLVLKQGSVLTRSLGMSPLRLRLVAYVLSALPAGVAGLLYAYFSSYVQPKTFDFGLVTLLLAASLIGGPKSIWAAPIGAGLMVVGPDSVASFEKYSVLAYGLFLIVAGVGFSGGIAGLATGALRRLGITTGRTIAGPVEGAVSAPAVRPAAIAGADLSTSGVTKAFGGVRAIDGVDFRAQPGSVTAIIGANGAGKTTLLNVISGLIPIDRGEVMLGGRRITGLDPERVARAGVSRTFQTPQVPEGLTVLEVAASSTIGRTRVPVWSIACRGPAYRRWQRAAIAQGREALAFVGLAGEENLQANQLPLGRRRILEVARSIAAQPSVVMFDEPAAGLDPEALADLRSVLHKLRSAGATVVLIEHNVPFVMDIADTVYVMALGKVISSGPPELVRHDPEVIASYLGRRHTPPPAAVQPDPMEVNARG